jgi:hypothetical protein
MPVPIRESVASRGRSVTPRPANKRVRRSSPSPRPAKNVPKPTSSNRGRKRQRKPTPPVNFQGPKKTKYSSRTRSQSHESQDISGSISDLSQVPSTSSRTTPISQQEARSSTVGSELQREDESIGSVSLAASDVATNVAPPTAVDYGKDGEKMAVSPGYKGDASKDSLHALRFKMGYRIVQFYIATPPIASQYLIPFDSRNCRTDVPSTGLTHLFHVKDFEIPSPFSDNMDYVGHRLMGHGHAQKHFKNIPDTVAVSKSYIVVCRSCFQANRKCFISANMDSTFAFKQHYQV